MRNKKENVAKNEDNNVQEEEEEDTEMKNEAGYEKEVWNQKDQEKGEKETNIWGKGDGGRKIANRMRKNRIKIMKENEGGKEKK